MSAAAPQAWVIVRYDKPKGSLKTILSVDGGGLRGLIPATVLLYVERSIKTYLLDNSSELAKRLKVCRITATQDNLSEPVECDEHFYRCGGRCRQYTVATCSGFTVQWCCLGPSYCLRSQSWVRQLDCSFHWMH